MSESLAGLLARLFIKVKDHMQWTDEKTNLWFLTENPNLGGATPDEFILKRPHKAEKWIDSMIEEKFP